MIHNGVVAAARIDDVGAAAAVDGVVTGAAGDCVDRARTRDADAGLQAARIDVFEIEDGRRTAHDLVGCRKVDVYRRFQNQRIHAGTAIDERFRSAISHHVVAAARIDDVGAAAAIDGVVTGAADNGIGRSRS